MRFFRLAGAAALLLATVGVAVGAPLQKGTNILALQLTEGRVDLAQPDGDYLTSFPEAPPEMGLQAQWWHFFTEEYALAVSGGIGFFSEKDQSSDPADPDREYSQSSWQIRVGGDRVGRINDRFHVFAGPGIQVWSGNWELDEGPGLTQKSENTLRIALEGRFGVHLQWTERVGAFAQLGHYFGRASSRDGDAKTAWWASGHDGAAGIAIRF